ncbi:MAG: CocE/NonD family hydrolase [Betaproteobacteria bacterium]|nr:CocE/NonD family hydrolase [Betaproteobacteria bacterium]
MFSQQWQTSKRQYGITIERAVRVPVGKSITIVADIYRPDAPGRFPVLLTMSPYNREEQGAEMMPQGFPGNQFNRGMLEVGDFNFYVRRGFVMVIANMRGTFGSEGLFGNLNPDNDSIQDIADTIEWLGSRPWANGRVAMNGVSYFSVVQKRTAALRPPSLKTIFAMYGWSDGYRDGYYRGGILAHGFTTYWLQCYAGVFKFGNPMKEAMGAAAYGEAVKRAMADVELMAVPALANALKNPGAGVNPMIVEFLLHPLYDDYHAARAVDFSKSDIPAYFGADWGNYGLHLAGDVRAYGEWQGPRKLTIGPPIYLDRPLYQYDYESLRWFDHWLRDIDTGLLDEAPINVFIVGTGEWKSSKEWPIPDTRWTPFYLHSGGLLSEHEHWPNEGVTTYQDSPFSHGGARFATPAMVEATEICGPIALKLYGSTTDVEVLWFVSLWLVGAKARDGRIEGKETLLTRGWLRGSQRALDAERSKPWQPVHRHNKREALVPGEIYEFDIELRPYGILLKPGESIAVRVRCADDDPAETFLDRIAQGALTRPCAAHVSVHHNAQYPSHLLLPVTGGNRIGTFISGGKLPPLAKG